MGENTTIALLTSINQRLQVIINNTSPKNRNPKEQDAKTVSSLHKGDTLKNVSDTASKSDNSDIKIAPMNMKDVVSTLAQMPSAIKSIVGLKSKNLNKFKLTMSIISNSMEEFSQKGNDLVKGGKTLEKIAHSFEIFNSIDLSKIFKQFEKIDKNKSGEAFNRVLKSIISGINTLSGIKDSNLKKFNNLVESLEKSTDSFTKLIKGIGIIVASTVGLTIAMKFLKPAEILQAFGIIALITTSVGVIAIGLSALDALLNKVIGGDPKNTPFDKMSRLMNSCVLISYGALGLGLILSKAGGLETMLYGLAGIAMVMVGIGSLAALVTALTNKFVKIGDDKEGKSPMNSIIKFMASAVVLAGVCIGLGFLVEKIGFDELLKSLWCNCFCCRCYGCISSWCSIRWLFD